MGDGSGEYGGRPTNGFIHVLSESLLHLPLWMIFRQMHINLCASDKKHLIKSGTKSLREYIV